MFAVILAGGSGSRLWPLSRELYPKQLLNILNKDSLLQETYQRVAKFVPKSNILSITNVNHSSNIIYQLSTYTQKPLILSEPIAKNTAPAIAIAIKYLINTINKKDEVVLIVPSDHKIKDITKFKNTVLKGEKLAQKGYLVTFGIKPTYAENGLGYLEIQDAIDKTAFRVSKFTEKPDTNTAKSYLKKDNIFWNSGIFMFKPSVFMTELQKHTPEIYDIIKTINLEDTKEIKYTDFEHLPNISIDYALMEKSKNIAMLELESDWLDVGSWKSIYDVSRKDIDGNVKIGHVLDIGSQNSLMYSSSKLVATVGLEDTFIVETEDAILACKKDKVQDVKQVFETLKQQHDNTQLVHKTVYRPWGYYTVLAQGEGFLTKMIQVNPAQKLSVQSHNHRSEHWVVLSGIAKVILDKKEYTLEPGHSIDIPVKAIHSLQNPYKEPLQIIEVQKGDLLIEEDIIRYEDMYGRV